MSDRHYDSEEGEFVDFATLEDWEARDKAKDARIEALTAERDALKAELADAVKLLRGSDAAFERIGYAADSIARESIRAFLARQNEADT